MDIGDMRNIVILKNLPSNLVEEAFVVLKENKKVKRPEYINENKEEIFKGKKKQEESANDYVVKEAEMLISNYISKLETN